MLLNYQVTKKSFIYEVKLVISAYMLLDYHLQT